MSDEGNDDPVNQLKRRHNKLQEVARELYAQCETIGKEINELREKIEAAEGEDYDPVPLMFGGGFHLHSDGEDAESGFSPSYCDVSSVRIWFDWVGKDHHEMWWKAVSFVPPIGMGVVPFGCESLDDWEFEHDDIVVDGYTFMAESSVLVVPTKNRFEDIEIPSGFNEAMERAGWIKGGDGLWR